MTEDSCLVESAQIRRDFLGGQRAAIQNSRSLEEIEETLLRAAIYARVPAGLEAFRVAGAILKQLDQPVATAGAHRVSSAGDHRDGSASQE